MNEYTGVKFFVDDLDIRYSQVVSAFSFYSGWAENNFVYPESWATGSATGVLNNTGSFYNNIGSGSFDGSTYMLLDRDIDLEDATIFLSYERLRNNDEILLSSVTGDSFDTYSGFCLGVNDANKLYFKYWNPVEGAFTFLYHGVLSDKNLIVLKQDNSIVSIGHYNNNTFSFEIEEFQVYENSFRYNNELILGGSPVTVPWNNNVSNFSGYIDNFFIFKDVSFLYRDNLASGLYSVVTGYEGYTETFCYTTGLFELSGFNSTGVTGYYESGFVYESEGITGYEKVASGFSYSGITGEEQVSLGYYVDNCGLSKELFFNSGVSGLISGEYLVNTPLTGIIYETGFTKIELTGFFTGSGLDSVTGEVCTDVFYKTGSVLYDLDVDFLASLSYKEVSLFFEIKSGVDIIEIFNEDYQNKTLTYNQNLSFNSLGGTYDYRGDSFSGNQLMLFANGQSLINSGYQLVASGYSNFISPSLDYYITGNSIYTSSSFGQTDDLIYDFFTGGFLAFELGAENSGSTIFTAERLDNTFIYRNGQKLTNNVQYYLNSNEIVVVENAGSTDVTGIYTGDGVFNNKTKYSRSGDATDTIVWLLIGLPHNPAWAIQNGGLSVYYNTGDTNSPYESTEPWVTGSIASAEPPPSVSGEFNSQSVIINEDLTGQNYFIIKNHPEFNYISGNSGSFGVNQNFNNSTSQVYFNGIKQKINDNYVEHSRHDLISGDYQEPDINLSNIYNNTQDFFV